MGPSVERTTLSRRKVTIRSIGNRALSESTGSATLPQRSLTLVYCVTTLTNRCSWRAILPSTKP